MFDDIDLKKVDCNQNIMIDWKTKLEQIEIENENKKSGSLPL